MHDARNRPAHPCQDAEAAPDCPGQPGSAQAGGPGPAQAAGSGEPAASGPGWQETPGASDDADEDLRLQRQGYERA